MSLLMSASPWTDGNIENKKRPSTMRKTIKTRPYMNGVGEPDEYINEGAELKELQPPSVHDVQVHNDTRASQVSELINKITSLNTENDGQHLANFNPMPNPILNNKKPENQLDGRKTNGELTPVDLLPTNPYQVSPPNISKNGNPANSINYSANDSNLGKLSSYNTSYQPSNIPYYAKMGLGNGDPNDKLLEKINYMIHLLEEQQTEKTNNVMEEFVLYTFLGVFMIYIVDSFVRAGKYVR
jgi:hypothetical protein